MPVLDSPSVLVHTSLSSQVQHNHAQIRRRNLPKSFQLLHGNRNGMHGILGFTLQRAWALFPTAKVNQ